MRCWLRPCLLLLAFVAVFNAHAQPTVKDGLMDLRGWDFNRSGEVKLEGRWNFYWQSLRPPGTLDSNSPDHFVFPGVWNGAFSDRSELGGQGFATYEARIVLDKDLEMLSLELPDFYCSYALWVNGRQVAANGEVGTSRSESVPQWLPKTIVVKAADTLQLVLHVSNFHHKRGGSNDQIYIGLPDQLYQKREKAVITNIILFAGLLLIGSFFVVLFAFFRKERAALFFAAICLTWAVRAVFTNLYLFINWFPNLDWELAVKIEYLTLYLTMVWSILFVGKLFPEDLNPILKYVLLIVNVIFILFTIATPAFTFTNLLPAYMVVAWLILVCISFVVVRAIVYERAGAWFTAVSIVLGVLMFSYDMLTYEGIWDFSPLLFNVGYLSIFFLNAMAFARQLSQAVLPKPRVSFGLTLK
jgi:hypothetical protein